MEVQLKYDGRAIGTVEVQLKYDGNTIV